jgi:hypothetical protein
MFKHSFASFLRLAVAVAVVSVGVSVGRAALVTDYFDYGNSTQDLHNLGTATEGWTSAWERRDTSVNLYGPNYTAGARLNFTNPDYDNSLNPLGSGGAQTATGNAVHPSQRSLTNTGAGDTWISVLARLSNVDPGFNSRAYVWLNPGSSIGGTSTAVRFAMQDDQAFVQMGTYANRVIATPALNNNETYLWLAHLTVNPTGNDALEFWIKSATDDISSAAALGTPLASIGGLDYFGATGLNKIGLAFQNTNALSTFDALRISNDPNAFQLVTLGYTPVIPAPEPASFVLLALGSMVLLRRKQKAPRDRGERQTF